MHRYQATFPFRHRTINWSKQMWYYRWWIELVKNGYAHWYSGFSTLRSWAIKHSGVCIYCGKVKVLELQGHPHSHHFTRLFTLWTALQGWRLSCRTRLPAKDVSSFGLDSPHCYLPPKGRRGASFKKRFYISSDPLLILEKSSLLRKKPGNFTVIADCSTQCIVWILTS